MDKKASSGADALQIMAVSFVVAGVIAAALLVDFGGKGRMIDTLLGRKDDWNSQRPRINRVEIGEEGGSKIMIVNDLVKNEEAAPAPSASVPAPVPEAAAAPAKGSWIKHISGSLAQYDIKGPATQHSSAQAAVTDAPAPAAPAAAPSAPAATVAALPTAGAQPAATAQPSYVNYGTTSRSDIMSSASGPVYNFAGKKKR
ncbi:MAG: hypothetical protein HY079_03995 [Elusimicrobia bacterium]|nr:hypothetical protein [Elusimicrobiota bacterium]